MDRTPAKRMLSAANLPMLGTVALLVAYGSVMVWSATSGMTAGPAMLRRHLFGVGLGLVPLAIAWAFDYQALKGWTGPLGVALGLLVISPRIPGLGTNVKGATSWLQVAGHRLFQPSEPAKLLLIVVMAAVVARYKGRIETPKDALTVFGILGIPLGLILLQPDLGTGLVFVAIAMGMLLVGGMKGRYFIVVAVIAVLLVPLAFRVPGLLKPYQKNRLLVFVDPTRDPEGAGYNLAQSKIAIGSGGLSGKGLRSGTQSNLNFIPERHTDFIFSVLGEELGFAGVVVLLGLYLALLVIALEIAASGRDLFGSLIAVGLISMWTFQILVNAGMAVGIMPITGIPLPFMSFGSSFMVTNLAGVGMLLSVWSRRYGA